jgi:pyruvate dehydrogenase E2 component (dihydrolipoamide acetyltransferase)
MSDFTMPSLGADMEEATVVKWLVAPGDEVQKGQIIVVVETVKGAVDVETFESGVIEEILVAEGVKVPVGTPLLRFGEAKAARTEPASPAAASPAPARTAPVSPGRSTAESAPIEPMSPAPARTESVSPGSAPADPAPPAPPRARMSPAARRRAREAGIPLERIAPSEEGRPIVLSDVERAVRAGRPEPARPVESARAEAPPREKPRARPSFDRDEMRRAIAAAMSRSKREIPHFYLGTTVDLKAAEAWREEYNRDRPPDARILMSALFMKATALALQRYGELNGHYGVLGFEPAEEVNLGMAIHLRGGGLLAPAVLGTDTLPLGELMKRLQDLVERARRGGLRASEMSRATATVTALGERGVDTVYGVIYPPQVAMIGFGRVARRVIALEDAVAIHPAVDLTLAADHRVCDGHLGARFLDMIDRLLQTPEAL